MESPSSNKPRHRPNQDDEPGMAEGRARDANVEREPRGIERGIADADKKARTGKDNEAVRDTPPAGHWNETSAD